MRGSSSKEFHVRVNLGTGKEIEVDVLEELKINLNDLKSELVEQPSKYALWATVHDVSEAKLEKAKKELSQHYGSTRYHDMLTQLNTVQQQHAVLRAIKNAFNHRMLILLQILNTKSKREVSVLYKNYLRALQDIVPESPKSQEVS